ncbi:ArsR/SmtB family transcription factor [Maritalea sp. S77]|uniref:ArsR/SmtB family transcription factor n=1 Tax=Maritalea sp. S77 TaxID=3415125 RepID=UPI003C7C641F
MASLDHQFMALADPTRRAIIARLSKGDATVSQLVDQFELTQPTISSHIKMLEKSGLITRTRVAQTRPCRLNPQGLKMMADWIAEYEHFWTANIDRFVELAENTKRKDQS